MRYIFYFYTYKNSYIYQTINLHLLKRKLNEGNSTTDGHAFHGICPSKKQKRWHWCCHTHRENQKFRSLIDKKTLPNNSHSQCWKSLVDKGWHAPIKKPAVGQKKFFFSRFICLITPFLLPFFFDSSRVKSCKTIANTMPSVC